ncbi:hypothetical protein [Salinicola lusitanus]|uniref:hypothetical protein n=1 Tax=Salinicola lusitanus TaxID=1949085 RepID=UPI003CCA55ED
MIISVGYRVKSQAGTRFRQWATLEAAMGVVRKAAHSSALDLTGGRGLVDIVARYAQIFWSPTRRPMKSRIQRWPACL